MTLRALTGAGDEPADPLLPGEVVDSVGVSFTETCREANASCSSGPVETRGVLDLETEFQYGAPFRFAMLLETLAENGGRADFAPSAWLERIQLPDGAVLRAASGWDYEDLATVVPEPGTLWLLALGLAAFGGHGASRESRS